MTSHAASPAHPDGVRFLRAYQPKNCFGANSLYMNWGLWSDDTKDVDAAATALVLRLGELAGLGPQTALLDVGFGFGDQLMDWCKHQGLGRAEGLNICPEQTGIARGRIAAAGYSDRVTVRVGDAIAPPFPEESFDAVTAVECAFHFASRAQFFAAARRMLKPGGCIVLADFIGMEHPTAGSRIAQWVSARAWNFSTSAFVTPARYVQILEEAGFQDVNLEIVTDRVIPPCLRYARKRVWEKDLRTRMDRLSWLETAAGIVFGNVIGNPRPGEYVLVRAVK